MATSSKIEGALQNFFGQNVMIDGMHISYGELLVPTALLVMSLGFFFQLRKPVLASICFGVPFALAVSWLLSNIPDFLPEGVQVFFEKQAIIFPYGTIIFFSVMTLSAVIKIASGIRSRPSYSRDANKAQVRTKKTTQLDQDSDELQ